MTLDEIRAQQHDDVQEASDAQLTAYLAGLDYQAARLDLAPQTGIEALMLARTERTHP